MQEKEAEKLKEENLNKISLRSFLFSQMDTKKNFKNLDFEENEFYRRKYEKDYKEDLKERKEKSERVIFLFYFCLFFSIDN